MLPSATARLVTVALAAATLGGCWIQPGYGPTRQGYTPTDGGTTAATVDELRPAWRATAGLGANRPIVVADRVVVTWGNHISAYALADGSTEWSRSLTDPAAPPDVIAYVGDPTWQYDGTIHVAGLIQRFGITFRLDPATGAGDGSIGSGVPIGSPAVRPDAVVAASAVVSSGGTLATLTYPGGRGFLYFGGIGLSTDVTDPMLHRDRAWIGVGSSVLGFDLGTCLPPPPPVPASLGCGPAFVVAGGATVNTPAGTDQDQIVVTDRSGSVRVLDAATRALVWAANTASDLHAPAIAPGRVVVADRAGSVAAYRSIACGTATCQPVWRAALGEAVTTQPAVAGRVAYVGTADGRVAAFATDGCGARTCAPLWVGDANRGDGTVSAVRAGPIHADGRVIVVLDNGDVVAFARVDPAA